MMKLMKEIWMQMMERKSLLKRMVVYHLTICFLYFFNLSCYFKFLNFFSIQAICAQFVHRFMLNIVPDS